MKEIALLFNPGARQGRARRQRGKLKRLLATSGVHCEWFESRDEADLIALARAACREYRTLVGVGGDTTFHLMLNEIMASGFPVRLGMIPTGSCNDIPREFGIRSVAEACRRLQAGRVRRCDVGVVARDGVTLNHFLGQANFGFGVALNQYVEAKKRRGGWLAKSQVLAGAAGALRLFRGHPLLPLSISAAAGSLSGDYLLAVVSNIRFLAGGFAVSPPAQPDDGSLDLCLVGDCSLPRFLHLFLKARRGGHRTQAEVKTLCSPAFEIASTVPFPIQADGRTVASGGQPVLFQRATIRALPAALDIIC